MRIVVTGATSGIGKALALHYARPHTSLGLIGRRHDLLTQVTAQCTAQGATVMPGAFDVRDHTAVQTYARQFLDRHGGIDIVIANAGSGAPDDLASGNARHHTWLFEVNVIGVLNTILPFVPSMLQQRRGQLVAIASVAGFRALPGSTTYAATKIALRALMEGYGWELQRHGITTTTINPGFVVSEMTANNQFHMPFLLQTDAAARQIARAIARKRRVYTFPWPMAILARLLPLIPGALLRRAAPRLGSEPS